MKVILVLGGGGLVGKTIKDIDKPVNYKWVYATSSDADLRDINQVRLLFEHVKPTFVIHIAANVSGLFKDGKHDADMLVDNIRINTNVIDMCHEFNVHRGIFCLSTYIFPEKVSIPINENVVHDGTPNNLNYGYAYAKRYLDILCTAYNEQYGREYIPIIPCNVFGPYDNFNIKHGNVIPSLIHKAYQVKQKGEQVLKLTCTCNEIRQYVYVKDMAKLCVKVLFEYQDTTRLLLAPNIETKISIKNIAEIVTKAFDIKLEFESDKQSKRIVDNKKFTQHFPDFEFTTIQNAIFETIEWFIKNYNVARK